MASCVALAVSARHVVPPPFRPKQFDDFPTTVVRVRNRFRPPSLHLYLTFRGKVLNFSVCPPPGLLTRGALSLVRFFS